MSKSNLPQQPQQPQQQRPQGRRPPRQIRICEHANTKVYFDNDLSESEHAAVWYSQDDFQAMKDDRKRVVKQQRRRNYSSATNTSSNSNCNSDNDSTNTSDEDDLSLRGLENMLHNGCALSHHKHDAVRSIVLMYRQLKDGQSNTSTSHSSLECYQAKVDEEDLEEVLRQFSLSKTSYAQHTAKYRAAMDVKAAYGVDKLEEEDTSTHHHSHHIHHHHHHHYHHAHYPAEKWSSLRSSSSDDACLNSKQNSSFVPGSKQQPSNNNATSLVQRRVPIRAPTA